MIYHGTKAVVQLFSKVYYVLWPASGGGCGGGMYYARSRWTSVRQEEDIALAGGRVANFGSSVALNKWEPFLQLLEMRVTFLACWILNVL